MGWIAILCAALLAQLITGWAGWYFNPGDHVIVPPGF